MTYLFKTLFILLILVFSSSSVLANIKIADTLSIGGQLRTRVENKQEFLFGEPSDTFTLLRTRVYIGFKPTHFLKGRIEIQDSRTFGQEKTTATALGIVDLHQGYVDILLSKVKPIDLPLTLRIGRQKLSFGDERVIGAFEWSNVARVFDAAHLMLKLDKFKLSAWASKIEETVVPPAAKTGLKEDFYGTYMTVQYAKNHLVDAYIFADLDDGIMNQQGDVYTLGGRLNGTFVDNVDYTFEIAGQNGKLAGNDLEAYAIHASGGYTFSFMGTMRLGGEFNYSPGDKSSTDNTVHTFDNLFPTNHSKYGFMDLSSWRNTKSFAARLSYKPKKMKRFTFGADYWRFRLDRTTDSAYRANGAAFRRFAAAGASNDLGQEVDLTAKYKFKKNFSLLFGYSHFYAGGFLDDTPGISKDMDFAYAQMIATF